MTIRLKSEREAREFFAAIKRPFPETPIALPVERPAGRVTQAPEKIADKPKKLAKSRRTVSA